MLLAAYIWILNVAGMWRTHNWTAMSPREASGPLWRGDLLKIDEERIQFWKQRCKYLAGRGAGWGCQSCIDNGSAILTKAFLRDHISPVTCLSNMPARRYKLRTTKSNLFKNDSHSPDYKKRSARRPPMRSRARDRLIAGPEDDLVLFSIPSNSSTNIARSVRLSDRCGPYRMILCRANTERTC
jgi:hypothetical protein